MLGFKVELGNSSMPLGVIMQGAEKRARVSSTKVIDHIAIQATAVASTSMHYAPPSAVNSFTLRNW